jgi:hypothetical protein
LRLAIQPAVTVTYKGTPLEIAYRIDLSVQDAVVVDEPLRH